MAADIPTTEPTELRAGDTWQWTKTLVDFPASAPWTLKYRFKNADGGFAVSASADGDGYAVTVSAATSADLRAGVYSWFSWVENADASVKHSVGAGTLTVLPDFRAAAADQPFDNRTHARTVLDAIEAVLEKRATLDQEGYEIAGRSLKRTPIADLIKLRQHYRAEVQAEAMAEAIRNGTGTGRKIQFRL